MQRTDRHDAGVAHMVHRRSGVRSGTAGRGRYHVHMQRQRADRRYTDEEVGEIIRLASRLDDSVVGPAESGLSLSDIKRIATELGIDESYVVQAATRHAVDDRRTRRSSKVRGFWSLALKVHGFIYGTTIAGLAALDLLSGGGLDFVQYPAVGWGVLLAWQAGFTWLVQRNRSE